MISSCFKTGTGCVLATRVGNSSIRISRFRFGVISFIPFESVVHETTIATLVTIVITINELLLGEFV